MNIQQASRKEYIYRINRVVDHVEANMDAEHSLESLARVANFSPYHFHRIFRALTGETLNSFVKRMRLQKAGSMLLTDYDRPVEEVATLCGFSSTPVFCRAFKEHFGRNTGEFRRYNEKLDHRKDHPNSKDGQSDSKDGQSDSKDGQSDSKDGQSNSKDGQSNSMDGQSDSKDGQSDSKDGQLPRNIGQSETGESPYFSDEFINQNRNETMEKQIKVKDMPGMDLIYVRHVGPFDQIGTAYEKLYRWAGPRGLVKGPDTKTMTVYHDDPKVVDQDNVRQSACIVVDQDVKTEGEVGKMHIPGGKYVVGSFEITPDRFGEAWDAVCRWLADSGYQPTDGYPYEYYPKEHEEGPPPVFAVDICVPVKPL